MLRYYIGSRNRDAYDLRSRGWYFIFDISVWGAGSNITARHCFVTFPGRAFGVFRIGQHIQEAFHPGKLGSQADTKNQEASFCPMYGVS